MKVRVLLAFLAKEDPNAEVYVRDADDPDLSYDFRYCSQRAGVSQLPDKVVILDPEATSV